MLNNVCSKKMLEKVIRVKQICNIVGLLQCTLVNGKIKWVQTIFNIVFPF